MYASLVIPVYASLVIPAHAPLVIPAYAPLVIPAYAGIQDGCSESLTTWLCLDPGFLRDDGASSFRRTRPFVIPAYAGIQALTGYRFSPV